jgi:hypothetical protein
MHDTLPPSLPTKDLTFSAKIDYVIITNGGIKIPLPPLNGSCIWNRSASDKSDWQLTIHDPTATDLDKVASVYENPSVLAVEIALDLKPSKSKDSAAHRTLLEQAFLAVAARFRPEDKSPWDYGLRGAVSQKGQKPEPLERRFARIGEEVLYGHRRDWIQAKLYLKEIDNGVRLPATEHSVRMEITLKRYGCTHFKMDKLKDMLGFKYRAAFTTQFRIIDRAEVRHLRGLTDKEMKQRTIRMNRAWKTAGVGKFAVAELPREDKLISAVRIIKARARIQLPADQYKLMRDQAANAKIGAALMGLQRRMRAR